MVQLLSLLSRIEKLNDWAKSEEDDWRENWMLIGTDVKVFFPRLSKERTSEAI